jgi:hypothetical protein
MHPVVTPNLHKPLTVPAQRPHVGGGRCAAAHVPSACPKDHLGAVALRYDTLLGRLGSALDGPGRLTDADAW